MNKICLVLIGSLIIFGCQKDTPLTFTERTITGDDLEICKEMECPSISIQYLVAQGNKKVANTINSALNNHIINILQVSHDTPQTAENIENALHAFISNFMQYETDFSGAFVGYEADISTVIIKHSDSLLSMELKYYLFTGGAHGYGGKNYLNFDTETGQQLRTDELINDVNGFTALAEKKFREEHNIAPEENINNTGYWFDEDRFHLPENIGITESEVILLYNQYEIASYAEGPVTLKIPIEEIDVFLRHRQKS